MTHHIEWLSPDIVTIGKKNDVAVVDFNQKTIAVPDSNLVVGGCPVTSALLQANALGGTLTATVAEMNLLHGNKATATALNQYVLTLDIADVSADTSYYVVCPYAGTVDAIYAVVDGAILTADLVITPNIGATPMIGGAITIPYAGSAAGNIGSSTPTAAKSITAGAAINVALTGAGSAGTGPRAHVVFVVTRT